LSFGLDTPTKTWWLGFVKTPSNLDEEFFILHLGTGTWFNSEEITASIIKPSS
jgi:hypothetical protein